MHLQIFKDAYFCESPTGNVETRSRQWIVLGYMRRQLNRFGGGNAQIQRILFHL